MSDKEEGLLRMFDKSSPNEDDLYDTSTTNWWAWSLLALALGLVVWLSIALVNAENQRYAMAQGKCQDPAFPGTIDQRCLVLVHSRDHWWQHLWYGVTHVK